MVMVAGTGSNGNGEFKTAFCLLSNVGVNLMIDLGAKVSLINHAIYNKRFNNIKLKRICVMCHMTVLISNH